MTTSDAPAHGHHHGHRGDHTTRIQVPGLGTIEMSRPELVFVGGIAALGVFGFLDWPLALVLGAGHLLAADRSSRRARELGEALEEAE
jgi:hypothetical protein